MESIIIGKKARTPGVKFDVETGNLEIFGRSIPEDSLAFYQPLMQWIRTYKDDPKHTEITAIFKLEYFNTSSSKCLLDLLQLLEKIHKDGKKVSVKWYYDPSDEDMEEVGNDYNDLIETDFELIELE